MASSPGGPSVRSTAPAASTSTPAPDVSEVISELNILVGSVSRIHRWIEDFARHSEHARASETAAATANELRVLIDENRGLQRSAEMAVAARDAAFSKLSHARRVIRDLLDEQERMDNLNGSGAHAVSPDVQPRTAQQRAHELSELLTPGSEEPPERTESSDETVRLGGSQRATTRPTVPIYSPVAGPSAPRGQIVERSPPDVGGRRESGTSPSAGASPGQTSGSPRQDRPERQDWNLQYGKPPRSAHVSGPIKWSDLQRRAGVDADTVASLESIILETGLGLRLHIARDAAFIYDPIVLDSRSKPEAYLVDWGRHEDNSAIERHIKERGAGRTLRTYFYPAEKGRWYHIGAFKWDVPAVDMKWASWSALGTDSKKRVKAKLEARCKGSITENEIGRMLDDGVLEQLCVKITAVSKSRNVDSGQA
ncbi:hypothetical protein PLICRDRAFT_47927 [Plicaturopsis crispa FD-325 SS-3]|nr:hypothetical protein PLICRDRAFT_47927 [Plicaturopsis crispa FD-325 SS-3]